MTKTRNLGRFMALVLTGWSLQPTYAQQDDGRFVERLQSPDASIRTEAARDVVAGQLPPSDVNQVVSQLIRLLDDELPDCRAEAAAALGRLGPASREAVSKLIARLADPDRTSSGEGVWVSVSKALGNVGAVSVPVLIGAIEGSDRQTYYGIMGAFAEMRAEAKAAVPTLIQLLKSGPEDRRWATIYALFGIGPAAAPAVSQLVQELHHENFHVQVIACRALAEIGPEAKAAVPRLVQLVRGGIVSSRGHAAMCLGAIGLVADVDVVDVLCQALQDENQVVRERALIGLSRLSRQAAKAQPVVERALDDPDFHPQPDAARTLWLITGDADKSVARLIELTDSLTHDVRALEVLAEMGPSAAPAAAMLAAKLESEDQDIRLLAAQALGAIGPNAQAHVAALKQRLADSEPDVCQAIEAALQQIGP